ncbi:MAG: hypothetical protein ACREXW_05180 [Gammaproteobacteria bacterium]
MRRAGEGKLTDRATAQDGAHTILVHHEAERHLLLQPLIDRHEAQEAESRPPLCIHGLHQRPIKPVQLFQREHHGAVRFDLDTDAGLPRVLRQKR